MSFAADPVPAPGGAKSARPWATTGGGVVVVEDDRWHRALVPSGGSWPVPVWAVTTGGDRDGYEVAAVFTDYLDARRYAAWWNREELRRDPDLSTHATAIAAEIDLYPAGTWQPTTRLRLAQAGVAAAAAPRPERGDGWTDR